MTIFRWLALIALLLTPASVHSQTATPPQLPPPVGPAWNPTDVDIALKYAKESRFDLAFPIFKKHAEAGDLEAMYHLGIMYRYGEGMKPDKKAAISWWLRAAKSGHAASQNDLGVMYFEGEGVKANKKREFAGFKPPQNRAIRRDSVISPRVILKERGCPKTHSLP